MARNILHTNNMNLKASNGKIFNLSVEKMGDVVVDHEMDHLIYFLSLIKLELVLLPEIHSA